MSSNIFKSVRSEILDAGAAKALKKEGLKTERIEEVIQIITCIAKHPSRTINSVSCSCKIPFETLKEVVEEFSEKGLILIEGRKEKVSFSENFEKRLLDEVQKKRNSIPGSKLYR